MAVSALGEWNKINTVLGGLPKIITAGIILSALVYAIIRPNLQRVRELLSPTLLYLGLIVFLLIWSLVIWIFDFSDMSSMIRGGSKMVFQTVSMLTAVSAVYMFGIEAIDLFALGIGAANGLIMLLEIPNYGIVESIRSLINCITTFGGAEGYARSLEIHDLTFVFGQLLLYYAVFAPTETEDQRRHRRRYILLTGFFFIVGMKRIAIPAVVLFALVGLLLRKRQRLTKFFIFLGFAWTAFFLLYIYGVRTGIVSRLFGTLGIDMMGREYLWQLANRCYTFSPAYMGHGFEYIDTVVGQWYQEGLLKVAYAFHNDILKVFVEIGFPRADGMGAVAVCCISRILGKIRRHAHCAAVRLRARLYDRLIPHRQYRILLLVYDGAASRHPRICCLTQAGGAGAEMAAARPPLGVRSHRDNDERVGSSKLNPTYVRSSHSQKRQKKRQQTGGSTE